MITAMKGSVSSSANTPHFFTGNALRGAQVPWVPALLTIYQCCQPCESWETKCGHGAAYVAAVPLGFAFGACFVFSL